MASQIRPRPVEEPGALLDSLRPGLSREEVRSFRRYLISLFLLPAILYFGAIPLVRMPWYESWGPSHWGPQLEFAFRTEGMNSDVVIFGDSSAFLGIDPRLVDQQLGITSVVLPNTVGSLPVNGDQALEYYLAHNTRPRLVVLYFTSWDLDYSNSETTRLFEGEEMMLRHDTWRQILHFARQHPLELPAFPLRSYSSVGGTWLKSLLHHTDREQQTAAALGHVDDRESYPALAAPCSLPAKDVSVQQTASVRALATKYRSLGYNVALYLAPVPACSNAGGLAHQTYDGLALQPAASLPPANFVGDGFYAHLRPEAVPIASRIFADAISAALKK